MACLAAGIVAGRVGVLDLRAALILLGCSAVGFLAARGRVAALLAGIFSLGAGLYAARYEILREDDLRLIVEEKPAIVTVRGRLTETPSMREFPGRTNNAVSSYARIEVEEIFFEKGWRAAAGTVASTTRGGLREDFFKGRRVEATGVMERPRKAQAPGLFDFRQYLQNSRVFYQIRCEGPGDWTLLSAEKLPITERFRRWAHEQLGRGLPEKDEPLEMVRAMALGTNQSLNGEMADVFMRTGTMHIFAISGLHVACIAACILGALRVGGLPRDRAALVLIPLVWFYTIATGGQSSAVRSALMSTFVFAGWAIRRPTELLNSTAGAAFLILLFQPEQLFQASFQLSFAVVAAIAIILGLERDGEPWTRTVQDRLLGYDPLLPAELRPAWKRRLEMPLGFVLGSVAISGASWIGSNPLTAYYFNMVTPVSLLANLVAVPLSSLSLAGTLGSLLLPPLGPAFNYLSWATMWETIVATRWFSHLSWGYFFVPKPNAWFFPAYFGVCAVCFIPALRRGAWARRARTAAGVLVLGWLCSVLPAGRSTTLTMLPIPGTPVVVDEPGRGGDLLVDCSNPRNAEQLLKRFLHGQGFGTMRNVLLTQADAAHAGGAGIVIGDFAPRTVFTSGVRGRSRVFRGMLAEQKPELLQEAKAGKKIGSWEVLHPPEGRAFPKAADNAVVLRGALHGWRVLALSGLGSLGQKSLLERAGELGADILLCGTAEEVEPELLAAVAPRVILLGQVATPFRHGKMRERLKAFQSSGARVVAMEDETALALRLSREECAIESSRERFALEK